MFYNRFVSLKNRLKFNQIYCNVLRLNGENQSMIFKVNPFKRCVHSSNIHEIDFLFSKYKLSKISNGQQSNGSQKSALHHFNTISDFNLETDKDITVETLRRLLNIRKSDANNLVKNYPNLMEMSAKSLENQMTFLSDSFPLTPEDFLSCPWILYLPINFIKKRLNTFGNNNVKKDHLVLLLLPLKTFEMVSKKIKNKKFSKNIFKEFNKKLNLFTNELHLIGEEFCDLIHENVFLFYSDYEKLKTVMDLVVSAGVESDTILSDIKLFTHNIEIMKTRIDICLEHKMPVKTWMLRSPEEPFNVTLRRHLENKKVLKDYENNIEYITKQLDSKKNIIHSILRRYPTICRISAKKLNQMFSFLKENGFTSHHIVDTPKILFHSVDTTINRIKELEAIKIKLNSLKILTLSEKDYNKVLEQFKQNNTNEE